MNGSAIFRGTQLTGCCAVCGVEDCWQPHSVGTGRGAHLARHGVPSAWPLLPFAAPTPTPAAGFFFRWRTSSRGVTPPTPPNRLSRNTRTPPCRRRHTPPTHPPADTRTRPSLIGPGLSHRAASGWWRQQAWAGLHRPLLSCCVCGNCSVTRARTALCARDHHHHHHTAPRPPSVWCAVCPVVCAGAEGDGPARSWRQRWWRAACPPAAGCVRLAAGV